MALQESTIIEALEASGGYVTQAAHLLNISFQGLYKRINGNKRIREKLDEIRNRYLDLAESKVVSAINNNQPWAICFYLKCQGKHRGWVERQELTGKDGGPVDHKKVEAPPDYSKLNKDELRQLQLLNEKLHAKA